MSDSTAPASPERPAGVHLDLDALADALVGELDDDSHLHDCAACSARLAELEAADDELRTRLSGLPRPELPDHLTARWQAALRSTEVGTASAGAVDRRRSRRAWPASVAASLVLLLAGGVGWTALRDVGGAGSDSASTAASGGGTADDGQRAGDEAASSSDGTAGDSTAPGAASDTAPDSTAPDSTAPDSTALAAPLATSATGLDYADPAQRATALAQLLGDGAAAPRTEAGPPLGSAGEPADGLVRLRDPAALDACLSALDGPPLPAAVPVLDLARFGARPALAVLRPQPDDPGSVTVTVVGAGCSPADPQVLLTTSVPRPR